MDTHVEEVVFGQQVPLFLEISYKDFKKEMDNHFNPNAL